MQSGESLVLLGVQIFRSEKEHQKRAKRGACDKCQRENAAFYMTAEQAEKAFNKRYPPSIICSVANSFPVTASKYIVAFSETVFPPRSSVSVQ